MGIPSQFFNPNLKDVQKILCGTVDNIFAILGGFVMLIFLSGIYKLVMSCLDIIWCVMNSLNFSADNDTLVDDICNQLFDTDHDLYIHDD